MNKLFNLSMALVTIGAAIVAMQSLNQFSNTLESLRVKNAQAETIKNNTLTMYKK